jgi:hypothetical protein
VRASEDAWMPVVLTLVVLSDQTVEVRSGDRKSGEQQRRIELLRFDRSGNASEQRATSGP